MRLAYTCLLLICFSAIYTSSFSQGDTLVSCSECRCSDDASPAGIMISHVHDKNQWMLSYRFMRMNMGSMLVGSDKVNDEYVLQTYLMSSNSMNMNMHMLMGMYGVTDRLTLMGMFHYNTNNMDMVMPPSSGHHNHGGSTASSDDVMKLKSNGFGDFKLNALYGLINNTNHVLVLGAGLNVPLASIYVKGTTNGMYSDQRLPYTMQLGSGTWDVLPVLSYLYHNNGISYSSQITSTIRTNYNNVGYRLGNELTFNNWFAYQWCRVMSSSVRLEGYAADHISGVDPKLYKYYEPAANTINYGGKRVSAYLGTNFYFRSGFMEGQKIGLEAGIPIYQYVNGPQMRTNVTMYALWSVVF